jgi:hypothetical protein
VVQNGADADVFLFGDVFAFRLGVHLTGGGNNVTIGASGFVEAADEALRITAGNNTFTNSGTLIGRGSDVVQINGSGGNTITLHATSFLQGGDNGLRVDGAFNSIANTGRISADLNGIAAIGGGQTIFNGGQIYGQSAGISMGGSALNTVVNIGEIRATTFAGVIGASAALNVTNSGTIDSINGQAIDLNSDAGDSTINNSGFMFSRNGIAIALGDGADTVVNNGFMQGSTEAVRLGSGNDFFDGRNGLQFGFVNGGNGNDTLFGGVGADDLRGGATTIN